MNENKPKPWPWIIGVFAAVLAYNAGYGEGQRGLADAASPPPQIAYSEAPTTDADLVEQPEPDANSAFEAVAVDPEDGESLAALGSDEGYSETAYREPDGDPATAGSAGSPQYTSTAVPSEPTESRLAAAAAVLPSSEGEAATPTTTYAASAPSPILPSVGCAENGSCYGDISTATGRAKTVSVSGYYRKDGTYVRGHYRSRARR